MKALVFLLVLANLLFYAFSEGYFGRPDNPDAGRADKQVQADRMHIVSRGEVPAAPVKVPEPVAPEVVAAPVVEEAKVETTSKPEPLPLACMVWEHLSVADADKITALLTNKFAEFKVSRQATAGEGNGWWVFVPPLAGKPEADKKSGELRQFGVTDYFIIPEGPNRFAISLGIFSSEKGAQERLAEVKEKGVRSARLALRPGKDGTVSLQVSGPGENKKAVLDVVGKVQPKNGVQACK